jgi:hypothetical protein
LQCSLSSTCGRCTRRRGSPRRGAAGAPRSRAAGRRCASVELDLAVELGPSRARSLDDRGS